MDLRLFSIRRSMGTKTKKELNTIASVFQELLLIRARTEIHAKMIL